MKDFSQLSDDASLQTAVKALESHGFRVVIAENRTEAKVEALKLIPEGKEVLTATSQTLQALGITDEINESGKYQSAKQQLMHMSREKDNLEMQKIGAAPEYVIGSVHAVTENGKVLIASRSGSQLPSYAYGASHVVWVVSTKKIVKDMEEGMKRIYEYVLPLESKRVQEVYKIPASEVRKLLVFNAEEPGRITIIFVKEDLGF
ncbi:MAG: LUD domain-containing protein [Candidatus Levyibacteriota bacterium]